MTGYITSLHREDELRWASEPVNLPEHFTRLSADQKRLLCLWAQLTLKKTHSGTQTLNSYGLKHHAEAAVGFYVSNGQIKGVMQAEGFDTYIPKHVNLAHEINWDFKARFRCPHKVSYSRDSWGELLCPRALDLPSVFYEPKDEDWVPVVRNNYPAICQATEREFNEFMALKESVRRQIG